MWAVGFSELHGTPIERELLYDPDMEPEAQHSLMERDERDERNDEEDDDSYLELLG
jgi:hypothetical protein